MGKQRKTFPKETTYSPLRTGFCSSTKMNFLATLLLVGIIASATCEDAKKEDQAQEVAEKVELKDSVKDKLKNLAKESKRAKNYYGTTSYPFNDYSSSSGCTWYGYCHYSSQCCGSNVCRYNYCRDQSSTTWEPYTGRTREYSTYTTGWYDGTTRDYYESGTHYQTTPGGWYRTTRGRKSWEELEDAEEESEKAEERNKYGKKKNDK